VRIGFESNASRFLRGAFAHVAYQVHWNAICGHSTNTFGDQEGGVGDTPLELGLWLCGSALMPALVPTALDAVPLLP
jgi:hypothetical protein